MMQNHRCRRWPKSQPTNALLGASPAKVYLVISAKGLHQGRRNQLAAQLRHGRRQDFGGQAVVSCTKGCHRAEGIKGTTSLMRGRCLLLFILWPLEKT